MKHQFSPKFRKLSKQDKVAAFIKFVDSHRVTVMGKEVSDCFYSEESNSIFFNKDDGKSSITSITTEYLFAAKIDGNTLSGQDEFGAFIIRFFNLTPASITL